MGARIEITPSQIVPTGVAQPAQTDGIADGHKFVNNGKVFVECENTHTGALDFTFQTPKTIGDLAVGERIVSLEADDVKPIGPFPTDLYNNPDGMVYLDYDETSFATQKVRVYRL